MLITSYKIVILLRVQKKDALKTCWIDYPFIDAGDLRSEL
jgi:hypothetical protein